MRSIVPSSASPQADSTPAPRILHYVTRGSIDTGQPAFTVCGRAGSFTTKTGTAQAGSRQTVVCPVCEATMILINAGSDR